MSLNGLQARDDVFHFAELGGFVEKHVGTGFNAGPAQLRLYVIRQNDEYDLRHRRAGRAQHVGTGAAFELEIEDDIVGIGAEDSRYRIRRSSGFADDAHAVGIVKQLDQACADGRRIFDDEYALRECRCFHAASIGGAQERPYR